MGGGWWGREMRHAQGSVTTLSAGRSRPRQNAPRNAPGAAALARESSQWPIDTAPGKGYNREG